MTLRTVQVVDGRLLLPTRDEIESMGAEALVGAIAQIDARAGELNIRLLDQMPNVRYRATRAELERLQQLKRAARDRRKRINKDATGFDSDVASVFMRLAKGALPPGLYDGLVKAAKEARKAEGLT